MSARSLFANPSWRIPLPHSSPPPWLQGERVKQTVLGSFPPPPIPFHQPTFLALLPLTGFVPQPAWLEEEEEG